MKKTSRSGTSKKAKATEVDSLDIWGEPDPDGKFLVVYKETPLLTSCGFPLRSSSERLISTLSEELRSAHRVKLEDSKVVGPEGLTALILFDAMCHASEADALWTFEAIPDALASDASLHLVPGPERVDQLELVRPLVDYLNRTGLSWRDCFFGEPPSEEFVDVFTDRLRQLRREQTVAVQFLSRAHGSGLLLPLALVEGGLSPEEYANGCLGALCLTARFGDVTPKQQKEIFGEFREHARSAREFLSCFDDPIRQLRDEIAAGEGARREFKETLRRNVRTGQKDPERITHAALKTIAAFLNTEGGTLFLGVSDTGGITGIDQDEIGSDDKYLRHLYDVIKQGMGKDAAVFVDAKIHVIDGVRICRVECSRSKEGVFLTFGKSDEEFFVRTGPATERLPPSKTHRYIAQHFS